MNIVKTFESALVVFIPAADPLVAPFRKMYDPSAGAGIPAHVTVLYPFVPPDLLTDELLATLRQLFLEVTTFNASFAKTMQFPDGLYLEPMPAEPFRRLTKLVFKHFPDTPPYGGEFDEIIPHLTVAKVESARRLKTLAAKFQQAAREYLPIQARVDTVSLVENASGVWQVRAQFALRA
jgi:2'-5' RNA ligase